jgi:hypothetical protein
MFIDKNSQHSSADEDSGILDLLPSPLVNNCWHFRRACGLHLHDSLHLFLASELLLLSSQQFASLFGIITAASVFMAFHISSWHHNHFFCLHDSSRLFLASQLLLLSSWYFTFLGIITTTSVFMVVHISSFLGIITVASIFMVSQDSSFDKIPLKMEAAG